MDGAAAPGVQARADSDTLASKAAPSGPLPGSGFLEAYTPEDLAEREQSRLDAERREAEKTASAKQKREADREREGFVASSAREAGAVPAPRFLSGSDREADELAARGQEDIFAAKAAETKPDKAEKAPETKKTKPGAYEVVEEDGYVKVKRGNATIAAGVLGAEGRVKDIEFTEERYRKNNMIRMSAMAALKGWEGKRLEKGPELAEPETKAAEPETNTAKPETTAPEPETKTAEAETKPAEKETEKGTALYSRATGTAFGQAEELFEKPDVPVTELSGTELAANRTIGSLRAAAERKLRSLDPGALKNDETEWTFSVGRQDWKKMVRAPGQTAITWPLPIC